MDACVESVSDGTEERGDLIEEVYEYMTQRRYKVCTSFQLVVLVVIVQYVEQHSFCCSCSGILKFDSGGLSRSGWSPL